MHEMTQQLREAYKSSSVAESTNSSDGSLYGCWIDDTCRRCKVLRFYVDETCQVQLIDVGKVATVPRISVHTLRADFASIPAYATKCQLLRTVTGTPIQMLSLTEDSRIEATVERFADNLYAYTHSVGKSANGIFLYYKDSSDEFKCLNKELTSYDAEPQPSGSGVARVDALVDQMKPLSIKEVNNSRGQRETNQINDPDEGRYVLSSRATMLERSYLFTTRVDCVVRHFESVGAVYVSLNPLDEARQELHIDVQREGEKGANGSNFACGGADFKNGDHCLVVCDIYPDGGHRPEWYRAKITSIIDENMVEVQLRDYGHRVQVDKRSLLPISDGLRYVQDLVKKVRLYGVAASKVGVSDSTVHETAIALMKQFECMAVSFHMGSIEASVLLWGVRETIRPLAPSKYDYININQELINADVVHEVSLMTDIEQPEKARDKSGEVDDESWRQVINGHQYPWELHFKSEIAQYSLTTETTSFAHWRPAEPIDKHEFHAYPQYVSRKLFIHVLDDYRKRVVEQINIGIYKKLRNRVPTDTNRRKPLGEWKVGDACFAPFDRTYHRATIKRIAAADKVCSVQFIDYGNTQKVGLRDLYVANIYGHIPGLAYQFRLANIRPSRGHKRWSSGAIDYCMQKAINKVCIIRPNYYGAGSRGSPPSCELVLYRREGSLRTALIANNYADSSYEPDSDASTE